MPKRLTTPIQLVRLVESPPGQYHPPPMERIALQNPPRILERPARPLQTFATRRRDPAASHPLINLFWITLIGGLFYWHATMTLQLFGPDDPWQHLTDEQPILSGRHALHLYHGYLGARSFHLCRRLSCYDPSFQAGYLKTPVFDSGSRPAELFLTIAGGVYDPAAYKVGLALCCLAVPILLVMACWGVGLGSAPSFLATGAGLLVWWSAPGRRALEAGDIDLLLAALAILAHVGLLIRFDHNPSLVTWIGMLLTGSLGWFAHPMLFLIVLPLLLVYYVSIGPRHSLTTWHVALALSELGALALNSFWLDDWVRYWWLRSPLVLSDGMLLHRTIATIWSSPQWGDHADRLLAAILLGSALVGVMLLNQTNKRVAARLLGLGTGGLWVLAILGISWEPLGQIGTAELMVPALWFAALPAAYFCTQFFCFMAHVLESRVRAVLVAGGFLAALSVAGQDLLADWSQRCSLPPHLNMGLGQEREDLVKALRQSTTAEARILWEDLDSDDDKRWTALLPLLTDRHFIGGLDPLETIEHAKIGLVRHALCGRPLTLWSDAELDNYCRRYNIGWVATRSLESAARFRNWKGASETLQLKQDGPVVLFTVTKAAQGFALRGQAKIVHMDNHHITLADLVPENGVVVLSLHYQTGMRAAPERVVIDGLDIENSIPLLRLSLDRPVARVTITWEGK